MEGNAAGGGLELSTGIGLPYVDLGPSGVVPVVLLHAWGESYRAFGPLLSLLPDTVRAIAFDQRGHGGADAPETGYSLADVAADVVAFMDAVGLSSAVLLGVSSGGYVAQQVAITHPRRVAGLVLVGSPRTLRDRPPFADEVDQLVDPVSESWVRDSLTWFPRFHDVPQNYLEDRVRDGCRIRAHVWRESLQGLCAAEPPTDVGRITCPTIIVRGDRDELVGREQQEDLMGAIPGSRLVTYERTGHLVLWEQPGRVAHDLTAFLDELTQGPPDD